MLQFGETIVTTWRDNSQKKLFQNTFLQNISFTKLFIAQHFSFFAPKNYLSLQTEHFEDKVQQYSKTNDGTCQALLLPKKLKFFPPH